MLNIKTGSNYCMIFMVGFGKSPKVNGRKYRDEVIYISGSADDVLRTVNMDQPSIVMLKMDAPEEGGVGMLLRFKKVHPNTRIFAVSKSHKYLEPSVRLGASGYLLQSEVTTMLEHGLESLVSGEFVLSDRVIVDWIAKQERWVTKVPITSIRLTPREMEVLKLVAGNSSNLEIAQRLGISRSTANCHIRNILIKLQVRSRVEAREFAIHKGYFDSSKTIGY